MRKSVHLIGFFPTYDLNPLFWDRKYNCEKEWINIVSCLNNLKIINLHIVLKILKSAQFHCPIQQFIITRSRILKQTFILPPSCCLSFCKYGTLTRVSIFPTIYYYSQPQNLQLPSSNVCVPSMFLLPSVGSYILSTDVPLRAS